MTDMKGKPRAPRPKRQFRHGDKPNWEIVLDAALSFGRAVSVGEIRNRIKVDYPDFAPANIAADLAVLSVNSPSRGHHAVNTVPRHTDTGNPYDRLIRIGRGKGVLFRAYDPAVHGVWSLANVGEDVLRPMFLQNADHAELVVANQPEPGRAAVDPALDARRRILAAIVHRDGQPAFRNSLLQAYGGRCAISDCDVVVLLEAAHIVPYRGTHTNVVENGLLLRADLHKLFDLHLFRIDPVTRTVHLSSELVDSEYACFDGLVLRATVDPAMGPLAESLRHHEERCGWMNAAADGAPLD